MKSKTINKIIRGKTNQWLATIDDVAVRELAAKNTIVTGGAIASMLLNEPVNDYDLYFRTMESAERIGAYYVSKFVDAHKYPVKLENKEGRIRIVTESGHRGETAGNIELLGSDQIDDAYEAAEALALEKQDEGELKFTPVFLSTNAITLSNKVQLVLRFYGEPDAIHENYDFAHCTNYWTSWNETVVLRQPALEALLSKELRYTGSKYPVCSIMRLRKFIKRGWTVNAGQILKMVMQISELDLTDPKVLEDQLTGVDSAYFMQLISKLREKDPEKINVGYLVEIIDRMF
jgi:hypothetical protein